MVGRREWLFPLSVEGFGAPSGREGDGFAMVRLTQSSVRVSRTSSFLDVLGCGGGLLGPAVQGFASFVGCLPL